jgi:hypothetical protein
MAAIMAIFCETGFADPIFGSPNHVQFKAIREAGLKSDKEAAFSRMMVFSKLWTSVTANLCKSRNIPVVMVLQTTFFEKSEPTELERKFKLGEPSRESQAKLFANFRRFNRRFFDHSLALAKDLGMPVGGAGLAERLSFIDEFHLDADGVELLSEAVGDAIEPLLGGAQTKTAKKKAPAA